MKITIELSVSTNYVGCTTTEEITFEVDYDATKEEIEAQADEIAKEWLWENIDFGWNIKN